MAIFSKKKEDKKDADKQESAKEVKSENKQTEQVSTATLDKARLHDIILSPRVTEKSVKLMDKGVYTFNVRQDANKTEIIKAIKEIYKVEPVKVRIVNYPARRKYNYKAGKMGERKGGKKAIVYLKEGDKISII